MIIPQFPLPFKRNYLKILDKREFLGYNVHDHDVPYMNNSK